MRLGADRRELRRGQITTERGEDADEIGRAPTTALRRGELVNLGNCGRTELAEEEGGTVEGGEALF